MLEARRITLDLTEAAREAIFHSGYDRAYGARPLKRAIQRLVQDPLAMRILDGRVLHGDRVVIDGDSAGALSFNVPDRMRQEADAV